MQQRLFLHLYCGSGSSASPSIPCNNIHSKDSLLMLFFKIYYTIQQ
jgi:hypothetical protein